MQLAERHLSPTCDQAAGRGAEFRYAVPHARSEDSLRLSPFPVATCVDVRVEWIVMSKRLIADVSDNEHPVTTSARTMYGDEDEVASKIVNSRQAAIVSTL